jgi:hypothetical protein
MAEIKTQRNKASVKSFIDSVEDDARRKDCRQVMKIMKDVTGKRPEMWGTNIVGYGSYDYKYASGREGAWFVTGFAPRKQNITLYIMGGFTPHGALMKKLGKHTKGKGCLHIKRLEDVDLDVLRKLIADSVAHVQKTSM